MNNYYNKKFIYDTIVLIEEELKYMSKWSVYNGDFLNDEVLDLKDRLNEIYNKVTTLEGGEKNE